jgi:hypothetical protein
MHRLKKNIDLVPADFSWLNVRLFRTFKNVARCNKIVNVFRLSSTMSINRHDQRVDILNTLRLILHTNHRILNIYKFHQQK